MIRQLRPLAGRLARGTQLEVDAIEPGRYRVTGGSSTHLVSVEGCSCEDHRIRGGPCKHRLAVLLAGVAPELRQAINALAAEPLESRGETFGEEFS